MTLDSLMQDVWQHHGKAEIPYTTDDLEKALSRVTGDESFANQFFASYITGQDLPDYKSLLANAGILLQTANSDDANLGEVTLKFEGKAALIEANTIIGSPLYKAGLDRGDRILAIDRLKIESQEHWDEALTRFDAGDTATIRFVQRGVERSSKISFQADRELEVVTFESADMKVSDEQLTFRQSWLGADSSDK